MIAKMSMLCGLFVSCALFQPPQVPASLTLPATDASFQERLDAYKKLAPKAVGVMVVTSSSGGSRRTPYVTLQDDQLFKTPSALLGLVSANTPTARFAAERDESRRKRWSFFGLGLAAIGVGLLLLDANPQFEQYIVVAEISGTALALGGLPLLAVGSSWKVNAVKANERALLTYDFSLRQTLGICYDDLKDVVYDCKTPPSSLP